MDDYDLDLVQTEDDTPMDKLGKFVLDRIEDVAAMDDFPQHYALEIIIGLFCIMIVTFCGSCCLLCYCIRKTKQVKEEEDEKEAKEWKTFLKDYVLK